MIKAEQIPPEAWDKICEAFDVRPSEAKAALAAALNAWEGMEIDEAMWSGGKDFVVLPLPLTQESGE